MSEARPEVYVSRSIEAKTLDALLRIEELLKRLLELQETEETQIDGDIEQVVKNITPTETPFMRKHGGRKGR